MDLPRDSSDLQIALACPACNGNGGFGIRLENIAGETRSNFTPCGTCTNGWLLKKPADLTPAELARLYKRLPAIPA